MFRSWPSDPFATRQPSLSGPTRFSAGTRASLKNTSLKSRSSTSHADANGLRTTPGRSVGIISALMPLCLGASGSVRTKASNTSASCAPDVHTFCPLTTKWSPSRHRPRPQGRQVGAGARFAHPERRGDLRPQDRHRPLLLLLAGAERDQRGGNNADALRVVALVDPSSREFQLIRVLLQDRRVAATELGWVAGDQPAVVEHQPLPATGPVRDVTTRPRPIERFGLRRQILVEKGDELGTEGLDVGVKCQLHGTPSRSAKYRRTSIINKMRIVFSQ